MRLSNNWGYASGPQMNQPPFQQFQPPRMPFMTARPNWTRPPTGPNMSQNNMFNQFQPQTNSHPHRQQFEFSSHSMSTPSQPPPMNGMQSGPPRVPFPVANEIEQAPIRNGNNMPRFLDFPIHPEKQSTQMGSMSQPPLPMPIQQPPPPNANPRLSPHV